MEDDEGSDASFEEEKPKKKGRASSSKAPSRVSKAKKSAIIKVKKEAISEIEEADEEEQDTPRASRV